MSEENQKLVLAENAATKIQVLVDKGCTGKPFAVVENDYNAVDLSRFMPAPIRHENLIKVTTADSFIAYFNKFSNADSVVKFSVSNQLVVGIIDFGGADTPQWKDHQVKYSCPFSKQWVAWSGSDKRRMDQESFAEFIENNIDDFNAPAGAQMLEIATKFQLIRKATFGSSMKTSTGEFQFAYSEENQKGTIEIPSEISLGLAPFEAGQHYEVKARIRYRLREGLLHFWYELISPEEILKDAFNDVREAISNSISSDILVLDI